MALVPLRLLLDHAAENGYGIPAFNVNNLESAQSAGLNLFWSHCPSDLVNFIKSTQ